MPTANNCPKISWNTHICTFCHFFIARFVLHYFFFILSVCCIYVNTHKAHLNVNIQKFQPAFILALTGALYVIMPHSQSTVQLFSFFTQPNSTVSQKSLRITSKSKHCNKMQLTLVTQLTHTSHSSLNSEHTQRIPKNCFLMIFFWVWKLGALSFKYLDNQILKVLKCTHRRQKKAEPSSLNREWKGWHGYWPFVIGQCRQCTKVWQHFLNVFVQKLKDNCRAHTFLIATYYVVFLKCLLTNDRLYTVQTGWTSLQKLGRCESFFFFQLIRRSS